MNRQFIEATVIRGHQVASGLNGNPRFPGGTIRMQLPHFARLGLDLSAYHPATINVSIAPRRYEVVKARVTLRQVRWHETEPAEDFSFFDCRLQRKGTDDWVEALIYYPHPETKPAHFQPPEVLELLAPELTGLEYGEILRLEIPPGQMRVG